MLIFRKAHSVQARLHQTPDLLRTVSDEFNRIENVTSSSSLSVTKSGVFVPISTRRSSRSRKCSCRPSNYFLKFPFWNANFSSSALIHREDCDSFKYPQKENLLNLRFVYCGWIISQAITASFHLKRGAGGFSISPKLNCTRVVPYEGSVFPLVDKTTFHYSYKRSFIDTTNSVIKQIDREFRRGNASPYDVDENGNTLLHVSHGFN